MDFVFDELANGRRIKILTIVDDCTKECLGLFTDTSIPALYVTRMLGSVIAKRGKPKTIRSDNGPEFAGHVMQAWMAEQGIEHRFIQPGKPMQNAFIESFNGKLRDECLSQHWFAHLVHVRSVLANWREDYNHHRPHSSLGYIPPASFAARCLQHAASIAKPQQSTTIASPDSESMRS
jgi:putative transposase